MILQHGKIYYCSYSNYHHDTNPVLLVLWSDSNYTHGINIRYLNPIRRFQILKMIENMQKTSVQYTGQMVYKLLRKYYLDVTKIAYRTYHTAFIFGTKVNEGYTTINPLLALFLKVSTYIKENNFNYLNTRAGNDMVIRQVQTVLANSRVAAFDKFGKTNYNPNLAKPDIAARPTTITPITPITTVGTGQTQVNPSVATPNTTNTQTNTPSTPNTGQNL